MKYHFSIVFCVLCSFCAFPAAAQSTTDSLALADSLHREALARNWSDLHQRAAVLDSLFGMQAATNDSLRSLVADKLKAAKKDSTRTKEEIKALDMAFKDAQKASKSAGAQKKQAAKLLAQLNKQQAAPVEKDLIKIGAQVLSLEQEVGLAPPPQEKPIAEILGTPSVSEVPPAPPAATDSLQTASPPVDSAVVPAPTRKTRAKSLPPTRQYARYEPSKDVMLNPPAPPCVVVRDVRDEFSGETYREIQREELFRFTNDYVKKIIPPGEAHVVCEAALAQKGTTPTLWLTFTIHDPNARKTFGGFNKNSQAVLKFIDGQTITVYNIRADEGVADASGNTLIFRAQYSLDREILKKIQHTELDKIRVAWATGYEDYDVQNINLLRRQASCL